MKTFLSQSLLVLSLLATVPSSVFSQVFLAESVFDDFFVEGDIVTKMQESGYRSTSLSELPDEISVPAKNLTNYLDQYVGDVKKLFYINESDASILICGVSRKGGYFTYAVNFFFGNAHAVERIREIFAENELTFDHEENGQYIYVDGEDGGGIVSILDNGYVFFGYFEM